MKSPEKPNALHAKKIRKLRRRRLEILQLRSATLTPAATMSPLEDGCDGSTRGPHSSTASTESSDGGGEGSSRSKLVYGHVSMMGRRRVMEDTLTVAPPGWLTGEYHFFAVYDGHGGAKVAERCGEEMHKFLAKNIEKARKLPEGEDKGFDWEKVMVECFCNMDEELEEDVSRNEVLHGTTRAAAAPYKMMGSTAMVVLVGKEELVVANCGDSRAVLCRGGAAVPMSTDHKVTCNCFIRPHIEMSPYPKLAIFQRGVLSQKQEIKVRIN